MIPLRFASYGGTEMTKLIAMLAVGLLAGAGLIGEKSDASQPSEATGIAQESGIYHLKRGGGSVSCIVARGADLSEGLSELRVEPSCEDVMPGMATVKYWRETDDTVIFSRDGDDALVTFAMADGVAYESFAPASPLLSLAFND
jgi:hypothetical protein